ncbi:MAG: nucleotidyl transferase AbiEii/AbiGii toxin family protein [Gammaproteobacteria bacterium]|nr:nucleotidyl transferase AbiEii/AbiGii toxin family protein [Gammaproteobacteria bacterium]
MNEVDVSAWVEQADAPQRRFREAVHTILDAIGQSRSLHTKMVMKGGLLMAIRYASTRFTRDIDFSTVDVYREAQAQDLVEEFERQLVLAVERLPYATACKLQSHQVQPKGENKTHQSLKLRIGYADATKPAAMQRLDARQSPHIVEIDYSYNEAVLDIEVLELDGGVTIQSYSLHNVLAEKLRSLLQQPIRRRNRRQDVYDVHLLLQSSAALSAQDLQSIHDILLQSCRSKHIEPIEDSMDAPEIVRLARDGYESLGDDIQGELPPFDEAMGVVQALYRSLPWGV